MPFLRIIEGLDTNRCLSNKYEGADNSQWELGNHQRQSTRFCTRRLFPDMVLFFLAMLMLALTSLCFMTEARIGGVMGKVTGCAERSEWFCKRERKPLLPLFLKQRGSWNGSMALNGSFVSSSALLNNLCRVFCRDAANPVYISLFPPRA